MKKIFLMAVLFTASMVTFVGCGKNEPSNSNENGEQPIAKTDTIWIEYALMPPSSDIFITKVATLENISAKRAAYKVGNPNKKDPVTGMKCVTTDGSNLIPVIGTIAEQIQEETDVLDLYWKAGKISGGNPDLSNIQFNQLKLDLSRINLELSR